MKKILCENNHYYDADRYDACPHCARAKAFSEKMPRPVQDCALSSSEAQPDALWSIEQLRGHHAVQAFPEAQAPLSDMPLMRTMPLLEPEPAEESCFASAPEAERPHEDREASETDAPPAPDDGRTHTLYKDEQPGPAPVVGWAVCVKGAQQGASFPLASGRNRVGRAAEMDVVLASDLNVSRNTHCVIIFDPASDMFYLQNGESRGLTYLNGDLLLTPQPLKSHDLIRAGETTLLFVPLCGAQFHWSDYLGSEDTQ